MPAPHIDQAALKAMLHYDPETGAFTWRHRPELPKRWNSRYAGRVAGFDWTPPGSHTAYRSIRIFDWPFLGHRLAWLYMTGEWPAVLVDHHDLDGLNNRWGNLREATRRNNSANSRRPVTNKTGFKGVSAYGDTGRFRANIKRDGRQCLLGVFDTAEEAHAAYVVAAEALHGEFARAA